MKRSKAAEWLARIRRDHNLSLRALASYTGLSHVTIANAEKATKGEGDIETWKRLADYFKEPQNTVLTWSGHLKVIPTKDDLIDRINEDLAAMSPEAREMAARMIRAMVQKK